MGILDSAKPSIVVATRDRARAMAFYRDALGLRLDHEDDSAAVFFLAGGVTLRVSAVGDFKPHQHTLFGFHVGDIEAAVKELRENGVAFNSYPGMRQDALGIWTAPGNAGLVAWFNDPDGNVLSLTQMPTH